MRTRLLAAASVTALVLTACGGGSGGSDGSERSTSATSAAAGPLAEGSAWGTVLAGIGDDGTVDADTAMAAFALAFGPVPGVTVPEGPTGGVRSGSGPLRWAVAVRDDLPADQREVLDAFLAETDVAVTGGPGKTRPRADGPGTGDFRVAVDEALARLQGPLGALSIGTSVVFVEASGDAYATAKPVNAQGDLTGTPAHCVIGVTPGGKKQGPDGIMLSMAHEVFHCYEAVWAGSLDRFYSTVAASPWMIEGAAEWAGINTSPDPIPDELNFWDRYLVTPAQPLFSRSYDAIGFYGQVAQQNVDLWPLFPKFFAAADNGAAYHVMADPAGSAFLDAWAPGFWRSPENGEAWEIVGKAVPSRAHVTPDVAVLSASNGSSEAVEATPFTNTLREIQASSDLIHLGFAGHARFSDANGFDSTELSDLYLCTKQGGECACPDESGGDGSAGLPPSRQSANGVLQLALTGGPDGTQGSVEGLSLDQFCKKRTTTTTAHATSVIAPCELFTAQNVARLTGVSPTGPGVEVFGTETTNQSGICEYGPNQLGGAPEATAMSVLYRPAGAPVEEDWAMLSAPCTAPVPGVGTHAAVGSITDGMIGCLLDGTALVTISASSGNHGAMAAVLRDMADRL